MEKEKLTFKQAFDHDKALDERGDTTTHRILFHSGDMENNCADCKALKIKKPSICLQCGQQGHSTCTQD